MTIVSEPRIDERPEKLYMGIRTQTPFKGMFKVVAQLRKELAAWSKQRSMKPAGPPFLRYHVIDMAGEMDIEVGIPVTVALPGDGRVAAGMLPAGRYASVVYNGSGMTGNKTLIEWAKANKIAWDRWDDAKGDAFRSRCETYLIESNRKLNTKRQVEVAIKLADEQPQ
jgi:effector-binding domain-containing protein